MTDKLKSLFACGRNTEAQRGTATLTAVLILALLGVFTAAAMSRVTVGQMIMTNDLGNSKSFYAAQASLEEMTRNFDNIFTYRLVPAPGDIARVQNTVPAIPGFTFSQTVTQTSTSGTQVVISSGPYAGLTSLRDNWRLDATATSYNGTEVHLTREFYNHKIPIFQFGIFYNRDLTIHPGPKMYFSGRVHSNANLYVMSQDAVYFQNRVTAGGEVIRDWNRNGATAAANWTGHVYVADPSGSPQELLPANGGTVYGSAMNEDLGNPRGPSGNPDPGFSPNNDRNYTQWKSASSIFGGNLQAHVPQLQLPIQIGLGKDPIELIKRAINSNDYQATVLGQAVDDPILALSRYCNKPGIRVSLSDCQAELPGGTGGIRLDGASDGLGGDMDSNGIRGYLPQAMTGSSPYQATRVNGFRLYQGASYTDNGTGGGPVPNSVLPATRQTWIKVEIVNVDPTTQAIISTDITRDFLSLGVTYKNPNGFNVGDSRSIINLQRYEMMGPPVKVGDPNAADPAMTPNTTVPPGPLNITPIYVPMMKPGASPSPTPSPSPVPLYLFSYYYYGSTANPLGINYVTTGNYSPSLNLRYGGYNTTFSNGNLNSDITASNSGAAAFLTYMTYPAGSPTPTPLPVPSPAGTAIPSLEASTGTGMMNVAVTATIPATSTNVTVLPFPINIFNSREGIFNANTPVSNPQPGATPWKTLYPDGNVPVAGVMSVIDIDVANLRTFLSAGWDGMFPNGLRSTQVPTNPGWILYVSDRRGDRSFDGEYANEDIYGPQDGRLQPGEDANGNGVLDVDTTWEAAPYFENGYGAQRAGRSNVPADLPVFFDHQYFRRSVRLINGQRLPGDEFNGFTLATENAAFILGNYNAETVSVYPPGNTPVNYPTKPFQYVPSWDSGGTTPGLNGTDVQVPASIAADAVWILSNAWLDANSFRNPMQTTPTWAPAAEQRKASETTVRAALFMGSTQGSILSAPNQGGGDACLDGGVHNFPRFLENWGGVYLNYCGSLINPFNSRQAIGAHKTGGTVYSAPNRNWTFDSSFLDITRCPPGTPLFQFIQTTGFRQTTRQER